MLRLLGQLLQVLGKVVTAIIRQLLLGAEADEVSCVISNCWRGRLAFISWILLKMVRDILPFWV